MEINKVELLSVGIDVGSSTSHLVFSNLVLVKEERSASRRFNIEERNIIYEGNIITTPLLDDDTIDIGTLTRFLRDECDRAGVRQEDIKTGAVIVTGETAKKHNARQIAEALSNDAGKFVAATAGPNFESLIAAMGSGATGRSMDQKKTILSCDIGGGTSNMALSKNGKIISTSCVAVGGRLLGIEPDGTIWKTTQPALTVMDHLGMTYRVGDRISEEDLERIVSALTDVLREVLTGPAVSPLAKQLMVTDNLTFGESVDEYSFSGGVAELLCGGSGHYRDIGNLLADKINAVIPALPAPVVECKNKIRATVIGAGAYSLSISGSSGFMDDSLSFPLRNVPVIRVDAMRSKLSVEHVMSEINNSFRRFDLHEGEEIVALYFKDPVGVYYPNLEIFAKAIESALFNSIKGKLPVILIFEKDIACSVGNVIRRETELKTNLLSLDELYLKEGDWIDIGEPLVSGQVFPVTVKSLVFNLN